MSIGDIHKVSFHSLIFSEESPYISLSSTIDIVANDYMITGLDSVEKSSSSSATAAESDGSNTKL